MIPDSRGCPGFPGCGCRFCTTCFPKTYLSDSHPGCSVLLWHHEWSDLYVFQFPLVTVMVCVGDIYHLLNFFSFSRWLFIGLATLGLIIHRHRHPELPRPFKVPLFVPVSFTTICLFTVGMSFYSDPVNISIGCVMVLSGLPVYYLVVRRPMPKCCHDLFYYLTFKLQVLLEVIKQEIRTY